MSRRGGKIRKENARRSRRGVWEEVKEKTQRGGEIGAGRRWRSRSREMGEAEVEEEEKNCERRSRRASGVARSRRIE